MTITFRTFIDNIEALSISGVVRAWHRGPPVKLETPDLPASWVQLPAADEISLVFDCIGGWPTLRATLVVAYEAVAQSRQPDNFDGTVDMMDNIVTALRAITARNWPGANKATWTMRQGIATVAGNNYWAIFTEFEGTG